MAKDDYFKIVYAILTELYEAKKSGKKVALDAIHPERFGIVFGYWADIMEELLEAGYISGFSVSITKTGRYFSSDWYETIKITMAGIQYLQDNSKMKQMYDMAKEVRDWIPGISIYDSTLKRVLFYTRKEAQQWQKMIWKSSCTKS